MATFARLAEPLDLGPKRARNRIMRLGTVTNLAEDGRVGDRLIAHYRTVARGGAATLVTEAKANGGALTLVHVLEPSPRPE